MAHKLRLDEIREFLTQLQNNNSREWFEDNRQLYISQFLEPAEQLVVAFGEILEDLAPELQAVPKIDKSIFRLHRDVRFSKNKEPYKTNLGIFLWEGQSRKMESSGFYFHLEPQKAFIATGMYMFTKEQLMQYRDIIGSPDEAAQLTKILQKIGKDYSIGGKEYKKLPKEADPDYKYRDLYLYKSIYAFSETTDIEKFFELELEKHCYSFFKKVLPMHRWLVEHF